MTRFLLGLLCGVALARWGERKPDRSRGGPVFPGRPYLVGEHGPERFYAIQPPDPHTTELTDYAARWAREHPE